VGRVKGEGDGVNTIEIYYIHAYLTAKKCEEGDKKE
jgi:hypothetical protein